MHITVPPQTSVTVSSPLRSVFDEEDRLVEHGLSLLRSQATPAVAGDPVHGPATNQPPSSLSLDGPVSFHTRAHGVESQLAHYTSNRYSSPPPGTSPYIPSTLARFGASTFGANEHPAAGTLEDDIDEEQHDEEDDEDDEEEDDDDGILPGQALPATFYVPPEPLDADSEASDSLGDASDEVQEAPMELASTDELKSMHLREQEDFKASIMSERARQVMLQKIRNATRRPCDRESLRGRAQVFGSAWGTEGNSARVLLRHRRRASPQP
jgi:hypothetical protein